MFETYQIGGIDFGSENSFNDIVFFVNGWCGGYFFRMVPAISSEEKCGSEIDPFFTKADFCCFGFYILAFIDFRTGCH